MERTRRLTGLLAALYSGLYVAAGVVALALDEREFLAFLWLPFGVVSLAFAVALPSPGRLGRTVAALVASAGTAVSLLLAAAAPVALWYEHAPPAGPAQSTLEMFARIGPGVAAIVVGLLTRRLATGLAPGDRRRRTLAVAVALPGAAAILCGLSGALALALAPSGFLDGIVALAALLWTAIVAAWLPGAWAVVLAVRDRPDPAPTVEVPGRPVARVVRG